MNEQWFVPEDGKDLRKEPQVGLGVPGDVQGRVEDAPSHGLIGKIAMSAALAGLPAGAWGLYKFLDHAGAQRDRAFEKSFAYDTAAFRSVDPKLIGYREVGTIDLGIDSPRAIATNLAGNLLVAAKGAVRRLSPRGEVLGHFSVDGTPFAIAGAPDGRILVGMKDHVQIYGNDGERKGTWGSFGSGSYLTSIAVAGDQVYVADAGRRVVQRCDWDGKVLGEIGRADVSRGYKGLVVPSAHLDVVVAPDGLVWVANPGMHRIEAYNVEGRLERFFGMAGSDVDAFFGCCNPSDFAMLADGGFITVEKGIGRIKQYDRDGRFETVVVSGQTLGENKSGVDVAVGVDGTVLVLERGMRVVRVFEKVASAADAGDSE